MVLAAVPSLAQLGRAAEVLAVPLGPDAWSLPWAAGASFDEAVGAAGPSGGQSSRALAMMAGAVQGAPLAKSHFLRLAPVM